MSREVMLACVGSICLPQAWAGFSLVIATLAGDLQLGSAKQNEAGQEVVFGLNANIVGAQQPIP